MGLKITGAGTLIALVYPVFGDGFGDWLPFLNAALIGFLGGMMISVFELDVFRIRKYDRAFLVTVAIRVLAYTISFALIVPLVKLFTESIYYKRGIVEHFQSEQFQSFLFDEDYEIIVLYALVFVGIVIFAREMSRKMGQGVLWNYIVGKYYTPREELRICMFVDLRSSTLIAETMPPTLYHGLIQDFFGDIAEPVLRNGGAIFDYVGDQARITWKMRSPKKNVSCIGTHHRIKSAIAERKEYYQDKYGVIPSFISAIHCGPVVIGEIGDVKSQIVYTGQTIFELSQVEKCLPKEVKGDLALISGRLLSELVLPALYQPEPLADIETGHDTLDVYLLQEQSMP